MALFISVFVLGMHVSVRITHKIHTNLIDIGDIL